MPGYLIIILITLLVLYFIITTTIDNIFSVIMLLILSFLTVWFNISLLHDWQYQERVYPVYQIGNSDYIKEGDVFLNINKKFGRDFSDQPIKVKLPRYDVWYFGIKFTKNEHYPFNGIKLDE